MSELAPTAAPREQAKAAKPRPLRAALILGVICFGVAPLLAMLVLRFVVVSKPPLPRLGQLPAFSLTDQNDQPSGLAQLRGKVWVADFIFTRCPSICPLLTAKMARIQRHAPDLGPDFQLVSFSVDPTFDTPAVLTAYMKAHQADPARWRFLTGPSDAIDDVVTHGFKEVLEMSKAKGPTDFLSIVHGGHFVLVDRTGQIRGYYDSNEAGAVNQVVADAARLLHEAR